MLYGEPSCGQELGVARALPSCGYELAIAPALIPAVPWVYILISWVCIRTHGGELLEFPIL